jgi:hypothetical protein
LGGVIGHRLVGYRGGIIAGAILDGICIIASRGIGVGDGDGVTDKNGGTKT